MTDSDDSNTYRATKRPRFSSDDESNYQSTKLSTHTSNDQSDSHSNNNQSNNQSTNKSSNRSSKQHRMRKPPSLYGYDWRLCMFLTQTVHDYLKDNILTSKSPDCSIDWVIIAAMMASKCAITADECRMLWKTIAYDIDEDGRARSKRLTVDDNDESDIDSELPVLRPCKPCEIEPSTMKRMDCFNTCLEWNDALDLTLLNVVSQWVSTKRDSLSHSNDQSNNQSNNRSIKRSIVATFENPASVQIQSVLPTTLEAWRAISTMFKDLGGISKSPSFLQSRFSMLTRTVFTVDRGSRQSMQSINQTPQLSTMIRTTVLNIMGVKDDEDLVLKALHGTSLNYSPHVVPRRRQPKTRQRDARKQSNNQSINQSNNQSINQTIN